METLGSNVFKSVPVVNCVRALGHWDSGRIRGSLFKPHDLGSVEKNSKTYLLYKFYAYKIYFVA